MIGLTEIAVCDDEKVIREQIVRLIDKQETGCRIWQFGTGEELLGGRKHFDMIFLDIQMEGRNGIETAREIRKYDERAVIVFVTVVKEYVFEAFDVGAFHYLLKPIGEEKFDEVFANAKREAEKRRDEGKEPTLFIKGKKRSYLLKQGDILYIENKANRVVVHTVKGEIEAWYAMRRLEEKLGNCFYRCHRGYIVNMEHIAEYTNDMIDMDNADRIYLAKDRYSEFVKTYMRYIDNGGAADA